MKDKTSSVFNKVGYYTVFYASQSKMITALPIQVRVVSSIDEEGHPQVMIPRSR
jgi:hypothetical protein